MKSFKVLVLGSILLAAASAQALLIDDFTQGPYTIHQNYGDSDVYPDQVGVGILSGYRSEIFYSPRVVGGSATTTIGSGAYSSVQTQGAYVHHIYYGRPWNNPSPNMDLDVSSSPYFQVDYAYNHNQVSGISMFAVDTNGHFSSSSSSLLKTNVAGSQVFQWDTNPGMDAHHLNWFVIEFYSNNSNAVEDFSLNRFRFTNVSAVPEPASLAILGLGVGALVRRRRATSV